LEEEVAAAEVVEERVNMGLRRTSYFDILTNYV
jgi:hypothetical protein